MLWENYFQGMNAKQFFEGLDRKGEIYGTRFNHQPLMSNSNLAMQAGEFAREKGLYDPYHEAVFKAFFTDCLDIGDLEIIGRVITSLGLDRTELESALKNETYAPILEQTRKQAASGMIKAAPTFVIEGGETITGAQPLEVFRTALNSLNR